MELALVRFWMASICFDSTSSLALRLFCSRSHSFFRSSSSDLRFFVSFSAVFSFALSFLRSSDCLPTCLDSASPSLRRPSIDSSFSASRASRSDCGMRDFESLFNF